VHLDNSPLTLDQKAVEFRFELAHSGRERRLRLSFGLQTFEHFGDRAPILVSEGLREVDSRWVALSQKADLRT